MDVFDKQKKGNLEGFDLSRKGSVDTPIVELVSFINKQKDMFTLSSCSGRIVILRESMSDEKVKKEGCEWISVSHTELSVSEGLDSFKRRVSAPGCVVLKFEPFVLHVQARNMEQAKTIHKAASESGFRNSGISLGKSGKIVVAVRSTHGLEVPFTDDEGNELVTIDYIRFVINKSNSKLINNLLRIKTFEEKLKHLIDLEQKKNNDITKSEESRKGQVYRRKKKKERVTIPGELNEVNSDENFCTDILQL